MGFHEASFRVGGGEGGGGEFFLHKKDPKHDSKDRGSYGNSRIDIVQDGWECLSVC